MLTQAHPSTAQGKHAQCSKRGLTGAGCAVLLTNGICTAVLLPLITGRWEYHPLSVRPRIAVHRLAGGQPLHEGVLASLTQR